MDRLYNFTEEQRLFRKGDSVVERARPTPDEKASAPQPPVYDKLAGHYDCAFQWLEDWGLRKLRAQLLRELPEDSRVLEVGAGTGLNFAHYPRGAQGAASEFSIEMLKRARVKPRPPRVQLVQARAEGLPFAAATFDAAFATLVFCSVDSPAQGFAELCRVVRPGGTVALLEHVRPGGPLGPVFDALNRFTVWLCQDHFNRRTAEAAARAGLRVERVEKHLFGVVQLIICRVI
ncbi:MAG: class I SAM-dependent methyltransferase [Pyrinomonadaceae bacterium]|nr:class I SAM-dependent methyltransferase [Pyrinomonadaceae bacterium]